MKGDPPHNVVVGGFFFYDIIVKRPSIVISLIFVADNLQGVLCLILFAPNQKISIQFAIYPSEPPLVH